MVLPMPQKSKGNKLNNVAFLKSSVSRARSPYTIGFDPTRGQGGGWGGQNEFDGGRHVYLLLIQHASFFNIYTRSTHLIISCHKTPHPLDNLKILSTIHTISTPLESIMATKPAFLFKGKETKKEEKAEKKAYPTKAGYAKAEAKYEKEKPMKKGMKK